MDDDPVLRTLADDLQRDDPRLAALLDGRASGRHGAAWVLLPVVVLTLFLLLPPTTVVGVLAILLVIGSPLAVCWLTG